MTKINADRLQHYTASDAYPLTPQQLAEEARQRGADDEILGLIVDLPESSYASQEAVIHALREVEASTQMNVWRTSESRAAGGSSATTAEPATGRNRVDEAVEGSFPASDPPSWTSGVS